MSTPILTLRFTRKRDILLVRQQARQIAGLLGFDPGEQAVIAGAAFEIACRALPAKKAAIRFQLQGDALDVVALIEGEEQARLRLQRPLPEESLPFATEDLVWLAHQLSRLTPANLFEEVRKQNLELLQACSELEALRVELGQLQADREKVSAA